MLSIDTRNLPAYVGPRRTQIKSLQKDFKRFRDHIYPNHFESIRREWEGAGSTDDPQTAYQRRNVFDDKQELFQTLYVLEFSAVELQVVELKDFEPYKELYNEWHKEYDFAI
ncbi:hypothetical protein C8R42DRAFT_640311 [Lentinula raphanica]|nr:hypothetical protein C8R42DRAFT_640311 [Lentinula raphanica]